MAQYRINPQKDGTIKIQARYQPFKGGATQIIARQCTREDLAKTAEELVAEVNKLRHPGPSE